MGDWSNNLEYEHREHYGHFYDTDEDVHEEETGEEETGKMTNEEMLDKVLRHFFPRVLFIREINEESHTKKIIFSDEWLKKPYKGGE